MKVTVVINNYNYSDFIIECVDSVINQTYKNIEMIFVDDGSTDNSIKILNEHYSSFKNLKIIKKENGGQLSTFNEAIKHITGELVFFLDADDLFKQNYIEEIVKIYKQNMNIDFVYCGKEMIFPNKTKKIVQQYTEDKLIGFSIISTLYAKEWVGSVTSSISMKTSLFKKILPIPFEDEWIIRADDCLVWGSSIFGANKYYCSKPLVIYRVHSNNNYYDKTFTDEYFFKREVNINKLFTYLVDKCGISANIIELITLEYRCRHVKNIKLMMIYLKILLKSNLGFIIKIKKALEMILNSIKTQNSKQS